MNKNCKFELSLNEIIVMVKITWTKETKNVFAITSVSVSLYAFWKTLFCQQFDIVSSLLCNVEFSRVSSFFPTCLPSGTQEVQHREPQKYCLLFKRYPSLRTFLLLSEINLLHCPLEKFNFCIPILHLDWILKPRDAPT